MAPARSRAHKSPTSSTTQMMERSRRSSRHRVQGSVESTLPQLEHSETLAAVSASASVSGANSLSWFLMRCRAARRAERGPSPGSLARSWISRSISVPVVRRIWSTPHDKMRTKPREDVKTNECSSAQNISRTAAGSPAAWAGPRSPPSSPRQRRLPCGRERRRGQQ